MFDATIKGNLTADPQVKVSAKGNEYVTFTVAHNETEKRDGEYVAVEGPNGKKVTTFFDVTVFPGNEGGVYETAQGLVKGQYVKVTGAVARRDYARKDGGVGTAWNVKFVSKIEAFERKSKGSSEKVVEATSAPF